MGVMKNWLIGIAEDVKKETGLPIENIFDMIQEMFKSGFVDYRTWNGDVRDVVRYIRNKAVAN